MACRHSGVKWRVNRAQKRNEELEVRLRAFDAGFVPLIQAPFHYHIHKPLADQHTSFTEGAASYNSSC